VSWLGIEGKGVVVTGAAGGIGSATARMFAQEGARVLAVDLEQEAVDAVVATFPDPDRHLAAAADLRNLAGHDPLLRRAAETFGTFDALAHCAAVLRRRFTIDEVTEDDWDFQIGVNLKATFFLNRTAATLLKEQGRGGRIVNFSSQGWWTGGFGGSVVYAASKGGVTSMTRGLARTYAKDGITVNVVSPGGVDTPMMTANQTEEQMRGFLEMIPIGRLATPEEIAGAVVFLASEQGRYITGATLNVSGGQLMY
jgi:NAD(P)-dependent dehydrogenase (short-subunit alcohol dehydrogenase family)